jgi:hypothetical protein
MCEKEKKTNFKTSAKGGRKFQAILKQRINCGVSKSASR